MKLYEAQQRLLFELYHIYDDGEAAAIADWVMESLTGWKRIDRVINKNMVFSARQESQLETYIEKLLTRLPVQYLLEEAWFCGMKFKVNPAVLIPRPETEELVDWVVQDIRRLPKSEHGKVVLDIGTGSGCIALGIKKGIPEAAVHGCDISGAALEIASQNGVNTGLKVHWHKADILNGTPFQFPVADLIVSNPPYIPEKDLSTLPLNVSLYEPHLALFASNEDPHQFYRAIARLSKEYLKPGGLLYFEIHESLSKGVMDILAANGFVEIELRKDLQGKDRMVKGVSSR